MSNNSEVQSFSIYKEYYDLITLLSKQERAELLLAISEYMFEDVEPELNDNQMKIFSNLKRPLDKSKNKSKNSAKQNQNENKSKTNQKQNENKTKTNQNQNENKIKSNQKQNENKTKTHQDVNVNVVVNNNTLKNKNNIISKESINNEDSNRDRVIGEEKETFPNSIIDFVEKNYGRSITPYEFEEIKHLVEVHSEPIVLKAYKIAFDQGHNKLSYIKGILGAWKDCALDTLEKIEEDLKKGKRSASERKLDAVFARARARMSEENE